MKELAIMAMFFATQLSLFGMAARLIYVKAPGWGWFLLVVALVALGTSIKTGKDACKRNQETSNAK